MLKRVLLVLFALFPLMAFGSRMRLLVHYHYHEPPPFGGLATTCDIINKRTNLIMFIEQAIVKSPEVQFHVTWSGHTLLGVDDFYRSVGIDPPNRRTLLPNTSNVIWQQLIVPATTDLCQRARAMAPYIAKGTAFDYVLFLNDSCRGPFKLTRVSPDGDDGVPAWLLIWMKAFNTGDRIAAVGYMSCEIDVHLQSWAMMTKWDVFTNHLHPLYAQSCDISDKSEVVAKVEVGSIRTLLNHSFSIASIWPPVPEFTLSDRNRLTSNKEATWSKKIKRKLRGCISMWVGADGPMDCWWWESHPPDLGEMSFVKNGGTTFRLRMLPPCFEDYVERRTEQVLAVHGHPHKECRNPSYQIPYYINDKDGKQGHVGGKEGKQGHVGGKDGKQGHVGGKDGKQGHVGAAFQATLLKLLEGKDGPAFQAALLKLIGGKGGADPSSLRTNRTDPSPLRTNRTDPSLLRTYGILWSVTACSIMCMMAFFWHKWSFKHHKVVHLRL